MSSKKLLWLLPLLLLAACGRSGNAKYESAPSSSSGESAKADTSASIDENTPINSPQRKIIHTADFHCRVQSVFNATTKLENIVKSVGGVVQESRMENSSYDTKTSYYKPDSLRQTQTYNTTAILTLRVPSLYLDSVIGAIPGMADFIDSRTLKQSDVTYQYVANVLKNKIGNNTTTTRAMQLAKKSHEPIEVQQYEDNRQEQKINRKMENMHLMEDVNYATLTVAFSQPEQVFVQTIVNPEYIARTPFLLQCKSALVNGWDLIKSLFVGMIKIWPFLFLVIAGWITFLKLRRRPLLLVKK